MATQHKESSMKRNILIGLLLAFTMMLITACGSTGNDASKFEGTWIAYDKNNGVAELTIESLDKQAIVSMTTYKYKALMDGSSSGLIDAQILSKTGETATVHEDYLLQKNNSAMYSIIGNVTNNRINLSKDNTTMSILYNEKDNTLLIENIVFRKKSDDNSIQKYLPEMQETLKSASIEKNKEYMKNRMNQPTIQFDFTFDDSILDNVQ